MKVKEYTSQYNDEMLEVVIDNIAYSIDLGFTREEQVEDFFFDFGTSDKSKKAFEILTNHQDNK